MDFEKLKSDFFEMESQDMDDRVICNVTYTQINDWKVPHFGGDAVGIYMGSDNKVGEIVFNMDDTEKVKRLQVDLTPHFDSSSIYTTLILKVLVDKDFLYKGTRTKAKFSVSFRGKVILEKKIETEMPAYFSQHHWPISKPAV